MIKKYQKFWRGKILLKDTQILYKVAWLSIPFQIIVNNECHLEYKFRPVLIIGNYSRRKVAALKLTTKYESKSHWIRKVYYHIKNPSTLRVFKDSYVDFHQIYLVSRYKVINSLWSAKKIRLRRYQLKSHAMRNDATHSNNRNIDITTDNHLSYYDAVSLIKCIENYMHHGNSGNTGRVILVRPLH